MNRAYSLLSVIDSIPDTIRDEEVEGLLKFLPPDTVGGMAALLKPHVREASLAFFKMFAVMIDEANRAKEEGQKIILASFCFPPEFIHVFRKASVIITEVWSVLGTITLEGQGEPYWDFAMGLGLPDSLCSPTTIEIGSLLAMEDFAPDATLQAVPGSCDANSKIHEFVARYLDIPQFFLEKPTDNTKRGRNLYSRYFRRVVKGIQEFVGEELDEDRMRQTMECANRCTELYYELWDLHKHVPCPVPSLFNIFSYSARLSMWGREEAVRLFEIMIRISRERLERGDYPAQEERVRTFWTYLGYSFDILGFYSWMEERGITYLGDALNLFFPAPVDTSSMNTMLEGIAEAAWNMPMTRQMGGDSMMMCWLDDVVFAIKDLGANCAVYGGNHSCKQPWSVFSAVRSEIRKRTGVPVLCLQGDVLLKRVTPMSVLQGEIASFVDNVVERKRRKTRRSTSGRPTH